MKKETYLIKDIRETCGSGEGARMYAITTIATGETEIVIKKSITERMPIQDYEKAIDLYERLTCGSGRKVFKLEELAHKYNPN